MKPKRVLILGGGFAGLSCARKLAGDRRFQVTLVDRTNHHLFQPLLYQVATASLAAPDIARSLRQILDSAPNVSVLMDEIRSLDPSAKCAHGASGRDYPWDYLVLATGARTSFFGNDQWGEHVLGLKTLEEAQLIRRTVLSNLESAELSADSEERRLLMTVAIVGGGPTGVELSGAFADLVHRSMRSDFRSIDTSKLRVILIEGSERLLEPYDVDQSEYARHRLEELGVEVWTGKRVTDVSRHKLHFNDGETLEAGAIIWAAGVQATGLTRDLEVELADRAGRIEPLPDLSLPQHREIFITGDLARMRDIDDVAVPGVAPAAVQMGEHVAKVMREDVRLEETEFADRKHDLRPGFRYFDKGLMAIIGKNHAVVKSGKVKLRGYTAWMAWLFIHVMFLIGFRNKLAVILSWAFAYLRNSPGARIIVHPPDPETKNAAIVRT
jgi:NADH dehydrogenase